MELIIKTPRPHKTKVVVIVEEMEALVKNSRLKSDKKVLLSRLSSGKQEIPIFCKESNRFFMANLKNKKARDVKSREDKTMCGVLMNAMCVVDGVEKIKSISLNWEMPGSVYKI